MFKLFSRQAVKAIRRPSLIPSSSATSSHIHSLQAPHSGLPSYDMIAQRFFSSQVDTQANITGKLQRGKKRKPKRITSYSKLTIAQTEQRLGFQVESLKPIPVKTMIANASKDLGKDTQAIEQTKEKVYDRIVEHLRVRGFPKEANPDLKEVNINYLVLSVISPTIAEFIRRTGRESVRLRCEKKIVSKDGEIGGTEEFVVVDLASVEKVRFILMVDAKKYSVKSGMKQCLLAMKDMSDNNGGGNVYGFVTTGDNWRMIRYNGTFQVTDEFGILFGRIKEDKERWMKDYSVVVDCVYVALSGGGAD